ERLTALAAEHGRPAPGVTVLVLVRVDEDRAAARRHAAEHLRRQYDLPLPVVERWAALGPAEEVAAALRAHLDAGADGLILMPLGPDQLAQYDRLAAVRALLPAAAGTAPDPGARP
ncbi:hypothetical protein ACVU7I_14235, partial [Patulibacter sp. S7RM1-6]